MLKEWRDAKTPKMSQRELGERLGLSSTKVSDYETGRKKPGLGTAVAIKKVTRIPVTAWLEGA